MYCRPGVKRVLVVLVDNESVGDAGGMKKVQAAKELYGEDVDIIPVAIGDEADPSELVKITDRKGNLIEESKEITPEELAEKIMEKSFGGKLLIVSRHVIFQTRESVFILVTQNVRVVYHDLSQECLDVSLYTHEPFGECIYHE